MDGLQVGRSVHFVAYDAETSHIAATIVKIIDAEKGVVNLCVFNPVEKLPDGTTIPPVRVLEHITYDEAMGKGTWHWTERA